MDRLTLDQVSTIMDAAIAKGVELGFKPLTVVVLDDGGNIKGLKRQDGSGLKHIAPGRRWQPRCSLSESESGFQPKICPRKMGVPPPEICLIPLSTFRQFHWCQSASVIHCCFIP